LFSRFYITNAFTGSGIHRFFPSIAGCSIVTIRVVAGADATWLLWSKETDLTPPVVIFDLRLAPLCLLLHGSHHLTVAPSDFLAKIL